MTTETISVEADARRWAIRTLGLDKQPEPPDAAAVLRRVTESEYALSPEWIDAAHIVANASSFDTRSTAFNHAGALGRHDRCRAALSTFIDQFFDLRCEERHRCWRILVTECANEPALVLWLNRLEPGLNVNLPPLTDNPNHSHLIQTCRDVFLARSVTAARLRREFCELWRSDVGMWEDVTDEALEQYPQFFEAAAPWVDEFGDRRWRESSMELKAAPAREPWAVPLKPIPPSRWARFSEQTDKFVSVVVTASIFGLVLAVFFCLASIIVGGLWHMFFPRFR